MIERAALVGVPTLTLLGDGLWDDTFAANVLAGVIPFLLGIPFALAIFRAEQSAGRRRSEAEHGEAVRRLAQAGANEAQRVLEMAKNIADYMESDDPPIVTDRIYGYWIDTVGARFIELTGDDSPLHWLRHCHGRLGDAVGYVEARKKESSGGTTFEHLTGDASIAATAAMSTARLAIDDFTRYGAEPA